MLDGKHTYCSQEATETDRGCEGIGLCNEFGIVTPLGYDDAEVNQWFPKIGVGFLQKKDTLPYNFAKDYEILPVEIKVEQTGKDKVIFVQTGANQHGWAWELRKTLSIENNILTIEYTLENTGQEHIKTEEYCHNFFSINRQTIGPDYLLETSFPISCDEIRGTVTAENNTIKIAEVPSGHIYAAQSDCEGLNNVEWKLIHKPSGHGMQVKEYYKLHKFAVWGMSHVISPEFFIWLDIKPGNKQIWKRTYTFY
ncbi:MAG: hypothetical protein JW983_02465 [Elusimicrobia bacterium]|nr:hypothetical protein [Elusimicrobiota bacterium]